MFKLRILKAKDSHFIVLITLLTIFIYIYGRADMRGQSPDHIASCLSELDDHSFKDSISSGICFVLFYMENSQPCAKEIFLLNQIAKESSQTASFFKIDVEKYPKCSDNYKVSGAPSILIFDNGKEKRRIMGVVSLRNIEIIYDRYAKL